MTEQDYASEINEVYMQASNWGYLDVKAAVQHTIEYGFYISDLTDAIYEYVEGVGAKMEDIDVCYIAYDMVLQDVRNTINDIIGFDIINDIKGDTEFYTYGNYCCTSYDYSTMAQEQLAEAIREAEPDDRERLLEDERVKTFLSEVDIEDEELRPR